MSHTEVMTAHAFGRWVRHASGRGIKGRDIGVAESMWTDWIVEKNLPPTAELAWYAKLIENRLYHK